MAGLHGGDDALFFEAAEIGGEQDLGVFDAEAEAGGGGFGLLRGGDDCGVWAMFGGLWSGIGYLFGGGEGVEGHVVGAVAYGVEAELEAGGGAFGGHLVEFGLVVAGEAGVAGAVGVGVFHCRRP